MTGIEIKKEDIEHFMQNNWLAIQCDSKGFEQVKQQILVDQKLRQLVEKRLQEEKNFREYDYIHDLLESLLNEAKQ